MTLSEGKHNITGIGKSQTFADRAAAVRFDEQSFIHDRTFIDRFIRHFSEDLVQRFCPRILSRQYRDISIFR